MKKLILLFSLLLIISCKEQSEKELIINPNTNKVELPSIDLSKDVSTKLKIGDIIYIKPDSTKVIIDKFNTNDGNDLYVKWFDKSYGYRTDYVDPSYIYLKQ